LALAQPAAAGSSAAAEVGGGHTHTTTQEEDDAVIIKLKGWMSHMWGLGCWRHTLDGGGEGRSALAAGRQCSARHSESEQRHSAGSASQGGTATASTHTLEITTYTYMCNGRGLGKHNREHQADRLRNHRRGSANGGAHTPQPLPQHQHTLTHTCECVQGQGTQHNSDDTAQQKGQHWGVDTAHTHRGVPRSSQVGCAGAAAAASRVLAGGERQRRDTSTAGTRSGSPNVQEREGYRGDEL